MSADAAGLPLATPQECLALAGAATDAVVLVTLIGSVGSVPQDVGAKMLVDAAGLRAGSVGGGRVEAHAIMVARELLAYDRRPRCLTHHWNLQRDLGMTCGGEVRLLFECVGGSSWRVMLFGAGHVAQALVRALALVDATVVCIDDRADWLAKLPTHPKVRARLETKPDAVVSELLPNDLVVCMTIGHARDLDVLRAIAARRITPRYLGVIGSAAKRKAIVKALRAADVSDEWISQVRCPIGLPIGSNHPGEIAISVVAELLSVRDRVGSSTVASAVSGTDAVLSRQSSGSEAH